VASRDDSSSDFNQGRRSSRPKFSAADFEKIPRKRQFTSRSQEMASEPPSGSSANRLAVGRFRRDSSPRQWTHPLESVLLATLAAHLVFLPWALGTMRLWAQGISLGLALLTFVLALVPRRQAPQGLGASQLTRSPHLKLMRFPIFWIGLALLGLVALQGLNPAWAYQTDGKGWWMVKIDHVAWLPSGVDVPWERGGPWRMLLIYASGWLTVCALWIGLTHRRSLQVLLITLAVNGGVLACLGVVQRLLGAPKIFWWVDSTNASFFASFIYKNHAGAYLNLAVAIGTGLAAWYYIRSVRRLEKSNPSGVLAFLVTCIAVAVLVSYARGATLILIAYLGVVVAAFAYHQFRRRRETRSPVIAIALFLVFGLFLRIALDAPQSELAWGKLREALSGEDASVTARQVANQASWAMLKDTWQTGAGSGSFRFLFTAYQQHYPEIKMMAGRPAFWENAHNDVLQIPIELGAPGMLLVLGAFGYWGWALVRVRLWRNALGASVILGCLMMIAMSWGEFVFQCPAILITWCALWPIATRWVEFDQRGSV
jgi:O-antigen ligase